MDLTNNLGFSLYAVLSTCYEVTTSERWNKVQEYEFQQDKYVAINIGV